MVSVGIRIDMEAVLCRLSCSSGNQSEFGSEILIHFGGLTNLDRRSVWVFPKLLVCLDCGFSRFTIPKCELDVLARGALENKTSTAEQVTL